MTTEYSYGSVIAVLKGLQPWSVHILNNYYDGRYTDYSARPYIVIASNGEEAKQVVLENADAILADLKTKKYSTRRRVLPLRSALPITKNSLTQVRHLNSLSTNSRKMFTPYGQKLIKVSAGAVVDMQEIS